jgi:ribonucleoside-triphosphate reductase
MKMTLLEFEKESGLKLTLEESPAESAARRLSKVDMELYPESKDFVRGSIEEDETYYTNSIHFTPDAPIDLLERIEKQSKFHPLIESGAMVHAFVGENAPPAESVMELIKKCWERTQCAQITISPEFTVCEECEHLVRGLKKNCPYCGSPNVYGLTRIVGYYSKISNWNKSKQGELKDRHKGNYAVEFYK